MSKDFAQSLARVEAALETIRAEAAKFPGELPELLQEAKFSPEVTGQILMNALPIETFNLQQKQYWIEVAETIGADWIESMRVVSVFMRQIDQFGFRS